MWIKSAGDITENCDQISTSVSTHILCKGTYNALFDASAWGLKEDLVEAVLKRVDFLNYIFITHAHFDHLGTIPYLKQKFPNVKIIAGSDTVKLLNKDDTIEKLFELNRDSALALGQEFSLSLNVWKDALKIDEVLNEGDEIDLGDGVHVKAIYTPGHTKDCMSYYIKPDGVLVSGDAVGAYGGRDFVTPTFSNNLTDYLSSLSKIENLEIKILSLGHSGVLSGDLVGRFISELANSAKKLSNEIVEREEEGATVEEIADSISREWEEELRLPEGPFKGLHKDCILGMVKAVLS